MEDNNIECPKCGEEFSIDFTRCPKCGLNLYPEEEEGIETAEPSPPLTQASGVGESVWAVVLGLILAGAMSFIIHMYGSRAATAEGLPAGWRVLLLLAGPIGALVGGFSMSIIGQRTRMAGAGWGALVGFGCAILVVLYETRWRLITPQVLLELPMLGQYALCLLGGALGGWLSGKSEAFFLAGGTPPPPKEVKGMSWEDLMYRDLLMRVRNRETAERLIEYERRQTPDADRYTLIRNAVDRLERDRGS